MSEIEEKRARLVEMMDRLKNEFLMEFDKRNDGYVFEDVYQFDNFCDDVGYNEVVAELIKET